MMAPPSHSHSEDQLSCVCDVLHSLGTGVVTLSTFIIVVFSQATQLPRSKPRSGSPLPTHHSHFTPCSCNPFPGSILGTMTQPLCLVHPSVGSTGGL